jgi:1-aminocyclopropane-1-carboxylate deaminase
MLMVYPMDIPDLNKVELQPLTDPLFEKKEIRIDVLRLDKIHTIISGNKWFKLKYCLQEVIDQDKKGIITFGGAYSNHLVATAYACKQAGLSSIGIIRGEEPATYSATLQDLPLYGMRLEFFSRQAYKDKQTIEHLKEIYPDFLMVDEGARGTSGIRGAEEILQIAPFQNYSHIMCSVGTGTMMTGILNKALPYQCIIGISSLKLPEESNSEISDFIFRNSTSANYTILNRFHFGGYGKKSDSLIQFMNDFYLRHVVPTDFVYTGKLFYAAMQLVEEDYFQPGNSILIIHSGGLQGNRSLPIGTLKFL